MVIKGLIDMVRPTRIDCDPHALLHNLGRVKQCAPEQQIMAIVKANAYGCGIDNVVPFLDGQVNAFGVASFDEAMAIRRMGVMTNCVLLQGAFDADEFFLAATAGFQCVIHHPKQLEWLLARPLTKKFSVWIKVNTGMQRLGFLPSEVAEVMAVVEGCPFASCLGVMTHFACADEVTSSYNASQLQLFHDLECAGLRSASNSAAILSMLTVHANVVRPGIMLYGVSPFPGKTGIEHGLRPVMRFVSAVTAIHHYPPHLPVGYGGTWSSDKPSIIGIVPVGYADGYPRSIRPGTPIWVDGTIVPIVGRVSMDMMTVDLTTCPDVQMGSPVELWGQYVPVEAIAESAGTIAYELLTKVTPRVRV